MRFNKKMLVVIWTMALPGFVSAADMTRLNDVVIKSLVPKLIDAAEKVADAQVRVSGDGERAVGIEYFGSAGLILIPQKGLSSTWPTDVTSERGTGLAHLIMSAGLTPIVDGKPVDQTSLRTLTLDDEFKSKHTYVLLAVRKVNDNDWRLYGYGSGASPVLDISLAESRGPGQLPIAIEGKDIQGFKGTIVITLFDKLQAKYQNTYSKKNRYVAFEREGGTFD